MSRLWPVVRREYLERVRSKAFVIATVVGPLLMAGMMIGPGLLMSKQRGKPLRLAVMDATGSLQVAVEDAHRRQKANDRPRFLLESTPAGDLREVERRLTEAVVGGTLDGYVKIPANALEADAVEYHGKSVSNFMDLRLVREAVSEAIVARRLSNQGFDPARVETLTKWPELRTIRLSKQGARQEDRGTTFIFAFTLIMLIYTSVLIWGGVLMNGVIEEKTSRVVEVIVSSISPLDLLAGKVLGLGAAGLTQFLVWAGCLMVLSLAGAPGALAAGMKLPEITPLIGFCFALYFLLGFFLYGLLYAAVGSAVNSTQEAQTLVFPVMMPLIAGVFFVMPVMQSPDSSMSTVLSLIPFLTPMLMFLRIVVLTPPAWQIALSIALCLLTIVGLTWLSSRIYRVGILMYGKRPTFPEILRWVRQT